MAGVLLLRAISEWCNTEYAHASVWFLCSGENGVTEGQTKRSETPAKILSAWCRAQAWTNVTYLSHQCPTTGAGKFEGRTSVYSRLTYSAQNALTATGTERLSVLAVNMTSFHNKAASGQGLENRSISIIPSLHEQGALLCFRMFKPQLLWPEGGIRSASSMSLTALDTSPLVKKQCHLHSLSQKYVKCPHDFFPGGEFTCLWKKDRKKETKSLNAVWSEQYIHFYFFCSTEGKNIYYSQYNQHLSGMVAIIFFLTWILLPLYS